MHVVILAEIELHPDDVDAAIALAVPIQIASQADAGCLAYAFARDVVRTTVLRISEHWESVEALRSHLAQPHVATFQADLGRLRVVSAAARQYTVATIGEVGS